MFHLPLPAGNRLAFTFSQWVDVENHLHRISGCRMTASYSLFHVIPDTDKGDADGCASSNVNFRHTCLSPILLACLPPRRVGLLFFPPKQQAQLNGWSRGLYYTVEGGGGGGGVEGGRAHGERGKGLAPNLNFSRIHGDTTRCLDGAG